MHYCCGNGLLGGWIWGDATDVSTLAEWPAGHTKKNQNVNVKKTFAHFILYTKSIVGLKKKLFWAYTYPFRYKESKSSEQGYG